MTFPLFMKRSVLEFPAAVQLGMQGIRWENYMDIYGYNPATGTTEEPIWAQSATQYPYISVPAAMTISSTSANDNPASTGLFTCLVESLDANYVYQSEIVTLDGLTAVALALPVLRVLKLSGLTAGTGGKNAGIVRIGTGTVTSGVPAVVHGHMIVGANSTLLGFTTVPAGKTAYISTLSGRSNGKGELRLYTRTVGGVFQLRRNIVISDQADHDFHVALKVAEKSDIAVLGLADVGTNKMSCFFEAYLV